MTDNKEGPIRAYQNFVRWWGKYPSFAWVGRHIITPLDLRSRNRRSSITTVGTDFPLCYLTATGRRTGQPRTVPLLYAEKGDSMIVTGTNFGGDSHPEWALNLLDEPTATLRILEIERPIRARLLTEDERIQIWSKLTAIWPGYDAYVERSSRTPLTFALEPDEK